MFAVVNHFRPSLISAGKLSLESCSLRGSTLVGSSLACIYLTRFDVTNTLAYYDIKIIMAVKF